MRTRISLLLVLATFAMVAALAMATVVAAAATTLTATLMGGAAEIPTGDPDGSGTATITVDPATREVCWELAVTNIAAATASHIHTGAAGVAGGVLVPLDTDGFTGSTSGCMTADAAIGLQGIIDNPAGFYVNVHTADYASGAVRGQLAAGAPNTALPRPASSPLLPLGAVLVLIALAGAARALRVRA